MATKKISELSQVTEIAASDLIILEKTAGTKIIRYEDLIADLQEKIQTDIKRAATYSGRDLTDVYTPAQLSAKIKAQDFSDLNIGDYFDITLTNSEDVRIEISGFNSNLMQGDGTLINTNPHITMTFRDCLKTTYKMNDTNDNTGGYAASALATTVNTTIYNLLPAEWKAIVMPTRRLEPNKGTWAWATRNMWLLNEKEVFGCAHWGEAGYGTGGVQQLPIFAGSFRHVVKGLGKGAAESGSRYHWWLATPDAGNTAAFCLVNNDGSAGDYYASSSYGVAPGFNIY